jgi:hypothetical protein
MYGADDFGNTRHIESRGVAIPKSRRKPFGGRCKLFVALYVWRWTLVTSEAKRITGFVPFIVCFP